jgi:hypothetical protein
VLELDRGLRDDLSAAKIGAPERTASASASDGRESMSTSRPFTDRVIWA